jgi:hypothetical protein
MYLDGVARTSAEWNEIDAEADQLDGQIEKLTNKQLDSMSMYANGWSDTSDIMDQVYADIDNAMPIDSEFGDLEGAMKAAQERMYPDDEFGDLDGAIKRNQADDAMQSMVQGSSPTKIDRGITTDSFTLGPNGLPIAKPKSTAAAVPDKKTGEEGKTAAEQAKDREAKAKADMAAGPQGEKAAKKEGLDSKGATLDDLHKSLMTLNMQMGQLIAVNETGHKASAKAAKSNNTNLYAR